LIDSNGTLEHDLPRQSIHDPSDAIPPVQERKRTSASSPIGSTPGSDSHAQDSETTSPRPVLRHPYRPQWSHESVDRVSVAWILRLVHSLGGSISELSDNLASDVIRSLDQSRNQYNGEKRWERRTETEWKHDSKIRTLGELVSVAATE